MKNKHYIAGCSLAKIVLLRYKLPNDTYIRSKASCYEGDEFSLDKGRHLAEKRLLAKMFVNEAKDYAAKL